MPTPPKPHKPAWAYADPQHRAVATRIERLEARVAADSEATVFVRNRCETENGKAALRAQLVAIIDGMISRRDLSGLAWLLQRGGLR